MSASSWEAVMQAEDLDGRAPAEGRLLAGLSEQRLAALIRAEVRQLADRPTWVDMRGLAEYLSWSYDKVKKLSARNLIEGKTRHEGKVTFHLPTVDAWLRTEYAQQALKLLPHEGREIRLNGGVGKTHCAAPGTEPRPAYAATKAEG